MEKKQDAEKKRKEFMNKYPRLNLDSPDPVLKPEEGGFGMPTGRHKTGILNLLKEQ